MRVQRSRTDALPLTWEIPVAAAASWVLVAILALPLGQGLAFVAVGEPFAWPRGRLVESLIGLFAGVPGEGLSAARGDALPPTAVVYLVVLLLELVLGVVTVWGLAVWWGTIGPGAQFGIARKGDVDRVLGAGNLRRRRLTIRPDLFSSRRREPRARAKR